MRRNSGFVSLAFATVLVLSLLLSVLLSGGVCLADNWVKTAEKGLEGNYSQVEEEVSSTAVYGSVLYAGTNDSKNGCQVWAYGGGAWTRVITGGFGDKNNVVARSMLVHNSRLYVGTGKVGLGGCEIWSFDGSSWTQVNTDGFGTPQNTSASTMATHGSSLFVGTENSDSGGQVWEYGGGTWAKVNNGGFGNVNNRVVNSLCVYGASLFAGTGNTASGCEVWKYDGSSWAQSVGQGPDGTIGTGKGFGGGTANHSVSAMAVWNDRLYAGLSVAWGQDVWEIYALIPKAWAHKVWSYDGAGWTAVPVGGDNGGYGGPNFGNGTLLDNALCMGVYGSSLVVGSRNEANGCQVWSWNGASWTMLNTFGFGSVANNRSSALAVAGSNLYIGTGNSQAGAEVWKYDSSTWQRLSAVGFAGNNNYRASPMAALGGYLYAGTASRGGAELWRTNGSTWSPVGTGGFGDKNNVLISSMATLGSDLYLGTRNSKDGGEVWRWGGGSLVQVNNSGFHPNAGSTFAVNDEVASMAVYNSAVWAGTHNLEQWNNLEQGCRIYRFDGSNWISEQALGFGDKWNLSATSMCVFGDSLFVGTSNSNTGCEVWKWGSGGWQQVNPDGFGSASNSTASSMVVMNGNLYVGVSGSTGQLWRYNGSTWSKVGANGFGVANNTGVTSLTVFGNTLYAGTTSGGGGQAWRYDGQALAKASPNGLGDTSNTAVSSLAVFGSKVFAGTQNDTKGCQILSSLGPPGSITGASPNKGSHGQTLNVDITGEGTHFVNGTSQASFSGTGITVNSTNVLDATHATANITIASGAGTEIRDVNVITGQDTPYDTTSSKFTVLNPRITGVSPNSALQGGTLDLTVTGAETSFAGGSQASFSGTGITVNSTTVLDATHVRANINVADGAAAGQRDVNVVTGGMTTDPLENGLTVNVAPPRLDNVVPAYGTIGDVVTLHGQWFGAQRGSSKVRFNTKGSSAYLSWSDDTITCAVPSGATSGTVVVTTAAGSSGGVAFKVVNTKPGTDVRVNAGDGTTVVFEHVTSPGNTISSTASDPVVDGFTVLRGTTRDVTTDAGHSGKAAVTLSYAGVDLLRYQEENLVLLHEEGGGWSDVTTSRNATEKTVTGEVAGLSKFAIAIPSDVSLPATATWYLAEGSTKWGFSTWITIENPNNIGVTARVTYMTPTGQVSRPVIKLPAMSQTTLNPATDLGNTDFSTKVECLEAEIIAVDRTMTWTGPGSSVPGAHSTIGLPGSDNTWYMPEGSSKWGFETWLLVQNPNTQAASCKITYMVEGAGPMSVYKTVPASSRASFNMFDDIGAKDASIQVSSDLPVICERSMYRNNRREGHNSIATTEPEADYYLAEGSTDWGFTTYVLVQNPNSKAAEVTLSFMTSSGPVAGPTVKMAANSRKTFRLNDILPKKDCSIRVHGSLPIIAERAMYWNNGTGEAMHASIGVPGAHKVFYLPDGQTIIGWETWTLVQNPNSAPVEIEVTYLTPSGTGNIVFTDTVPANSRKTYNMGTKIMNQRAAVMVKCKTSGKKIIVERSMYWNNRGSGTCTIGGYSD